MSMHADDRLRIHVNIEITAPALQAIVAYAKQTAAKSETGAYRVDTAETVSELITRFLEEKDFEGYVQQLSSR